MNFSGHSLDVVNVINLLLIQNLDSYFLASVDMKALLNLAKSSLTKSLLNFVVSDHFSSLNNLWGMLDRHYDLCLIFRIRPLYHIFSFRFSCYRLKSREVSSLLSLRTLDVLRILVNLEIYLRFVIYFTILIVIINHELLALSEHLIVNVHFKVLLEKINVLLIILKVLILLVLHSRWSQIYRFLDRLGLFTRDWLRPWYATILNVSTV